MQTKLKIYDYNTKRKLWNHDECGAKSKKQKQNTY